MTDDTIYSNIREILRPILGQRIVEITQHEQDEYHETGDAFVMLHFENGATLQFHIGDDGFDLDDPNA